MNKWKEVAELLDLELEEEFRFIEYSGNKSACIFKFTNDGLFYVSENGNFWLISNNENVLSRLISGTYEVVKLPWKPKEDDCYYYVFIRKSTTFDVGFEHWENYATDYAMWKAGNCFKTEKEAREKGIPLMKKIIEEFENENE